MNPKGLAPRAFEGIFEIIEQNKDKFECSLSVYMVELYCDQIQDLLATKADAGTKYTIKKDKKGMVYVTGKNWQIIFWKLLKKIELHQKYEIWVQFI